MTDQQILDTLSEIESELFYRMDGQKNPPHELKNFHKTVNSLLWKWHEITGLKIS